MKEEEKDSENKIEEVRGMGMGIGMERVLCVK